MYARTPLTNGQLQQDKMVPSKGLTASPTIPIAYPAATPANPTDRPDPRCMKLLVTRYTTLTSTLFDAKYCCGYLGYVRVKTGILSRRGIHRSSDEHCDDQTIYCNDTRHDYRNQRLLPVSILRVVLWCSVPCLHNQIRSVCAHSSNPNSRLGCPVSCAHTCVL
jgi:hypothetical protein